MAVCNLTYFCIYMPLLYCNPLQNIILLLNTTNVFKKVSFFRSHRLKASKHRKLPISVNPFNPKYLEWYSPVFDLEHTILICRGERVKY